MYPSTAFGTFIDGGRAYRITDPFPPSPLYNVLCSDEAYYTEVSHYGTAEAFQQAPDGLVNTVVDGDQKTLYCRDEAGGDVWCPGVYPMMSQVTDFVCEHHDAYTELSSVRNDIRVSWRLCVPLAGAREIWTVTVQNLRAQPARISLVPAARLICSGFPAIRFFTLQDHCSDCRFDAGLNGMFFRAGNPNTPWRRRHVVLAAASPVADYSGDARDFLGAPQAMQHPQALMSGGDLGRADVATGSPFVALRCELAVAPRAAERVDFVFGLAESRQEARRFADDIARPEAADELVRQTVDELRRRRDRLTVRTPRPLVDAMVNLWIKKGLEYCLNKKDATRDSLQFADGLVMSRPELARREILKALRHQASEGWAVRSWVPMDRARYGDSHLWSILTACGYLKFSNDLGLLEEVVPFLDGGEGTVLEHLRRAIACTDADRGPRGLPRIRHADWNDALNLADPDAESVVCAMMFGRMLKEMAELMRHLDRPGDADRHAAMHAELKRTVNEVAWDERGGHYVRAFADGKAIGGMGDGQVFLNPQSWAILGDIVPAERLGRILRVVDERLETDFGSAVNLPGYDEWDPRMGRITAQLRGSGENGGVYCHATGFKMMADTLAGRGDEALRSIRKILPDSEWNPAERSGATPYALTSSYSLVPEILGRAGRPWLTGTQCWFMGAVVEGLLGVRRAYGGLLMTPALPSGWNEAEVRVRRLADSYLIRIRRGGASTVTLDGRPLKGSFVPFQDEGEHEVIVSVQDR